MLNLLTLILEKRNWQELSLSLRVKRRERKMPIEIDITHNLKILRFYFLKCFWEQKKYWIPLVEDLHFTIDKNNKIKPIWKNNLFETEQEYGIYLFFTPFFFYFLLSLGTTTKHLTDCDCMGVGMAVFVCVCIFSFTNSGFVLLLPSNHFFCFSVPVGMIFWFAIHLGIILIHMYVLLRFSSIFKM